MRSGYCLRALGGWLSGCAAATVTLYAIVIFALGMVPGGEAVGLAAVAILGLAYVVPIIFITTFVLSGFPAALVIWFSEKFRLRSILFFGGAGVAIGVLIHSVLTHVALRGLALQSTVGSPFVVAGLVAGLTYWRVAGKHAGRSRSGDQA